MNYKIPSFALVHGGKRDQKIMMAGYSKHVGFYPSLAVIEALGDRLGANTNLPKGQFSVP